MTISGSNMNYGNQWSGTLSNFRFSQWSGTNMFYGNPTSTSGNYLYGNVSIPNNQNTGWYDLEVYDQNTGQWIQKNNAFYVNYVIPTPEINQFSPNNGNPGQTFIRIYQWFKYELWQSMVWNYSTFKFLNGVELIHSMEINKHIWKLFVWKC